MRKGGEGKGARKPTYGAATRLARLIFGLGIQPWGRSFEAITEELGITERTLLRYIDVCSRELVDWNGKPLLEVHRQGERRMLRLARDARSPDATAWEAACLYLFLRQASFLEGTVFHEILDSLWHRTWESLSTGYRQQFANLERKLFAVPEAPAAYGDRYEHLDWIFRALIYQHRLRIHHEAPDGEPQTHELDPYTLAIFRGRLCLIARSHPGAETFLLPIERIRRIERLANGEGAAERFTYPSGYDPADLVAALTEALGTPEPPDSPGAPTATPGLKRRGPRRASRTPRNKRVAPLFGRVGGA